MVSRDGSSFTMEVIGETEQLTVSGQGQLSSKNILLKGKTSLGNATVSLLFNDSRILTALSDEEGNWSISASADGLGIQSGDNVLVRVDAVAGKGDLISERVRVYEIIVSRAITGELQEVTDNLTKATVVVLTTAKDVQKTVVKTAKQVEPQTQATLVTAVPIVTVVNPTIALNLPNLPLFMFHFGSWLASVLGIRKRRKPWGTVYDAITKEPVSLAIVRLFRLEAAAPGGAEPLSGPGAAADSEFGTAAEHKVLVETQVTDAQGRFGFLPKPGKYLIEVAKPGFNYPSNIVSAGQDGDYEQVYRSQEFNITSPEQTLTSSVPLDPVNRKEEASKAKSKGGIKALVFGVRRISEKVALPLMIIGLAASGITAMSSQTVTNYIILGLYALFSLFQLALRPKKVKPWGVVYETATLKPVPLAVVNILDTQYNKLLKTRLTDYEGRFSFLPPTGKYKLLIQKPGYKFPSEKKDVKAKGYGNNYFGGEFQVSKEKQVIDIDVPLDPA